MPGWIRWLVAASWIGAAACGGSKSPTTPTTPTTTTPTLTGLSISGLDAIRSGFASSYTAAATMSDGTSQTVTATWSSSNTDIAQVDTTGRVDGRAHGSATLTATYQSRTATRTINVVQNYGGQWQGVYQMRACDNSGIFQQVGWCRELGGAGALLGFTLSLTQTGNGRDQISGVLDLGEFPANVTGNVTPDGRLVVGGTSNVAAEGVTFTITIGGWDTRAAAGDTMTGGWAQNLSAANVPGNAYMENRITSIAHTAAQVTVAAAPSMHSLDPREVIERMLRR
jgi:hypothetical protein